MLSSFDRDRRGLLKQGLFGALLLTAAGPVARVLAGRVSADWLGPHDLELFRAVARQLLVGSLPPESTAAEEALDELLPLVDLAIRHQPEHVRGELREFLDLLQLAPARLALCGFWSDWADTDPEDIDWFLGWWRGSRIDLLRAGYLGLHELIVPSYFMLPLSWTRIGYADQADIVRAEDPLAAQ